MSGPVATDMSECFKQAAKGSVEAQTAILDDLVMAGLRPGSISIQYLAGIELWARMLAAHGHRDGRRRLAGVLLYKGAVFGVDGPNPVSELLIDEGLNCLRELAEGGDERAAAQLTELSRRLDKKQSLPAEIMLGDVASTSH